MRHDPQLLEIAWAAGLFEGEGSMGRNIKSRTRSLVLAMCDEDIVRRFHVVVGVGRVTFHAPPSKHPNWSPQWRWECSRWDEIEPTLRSILPWLGLRRSAKAQEMLHDPPAYTMGRGDHCYRGHDKADAYEYRGRRACRECRRIASAKHAAKKKTASPAP